MCCFRKSICIWSLLLVIAELSMQVIQITTVNTKFSFVIHKDFTGNIEKRMKKTHMQMVEF